mmetsp:Transcript_21878/g.55268  ORF Transcript_21878/g.55268 Transcript_21878/m.55268 type:complete len:319 (-) Transcript_21878:294-1250(-)|eukprot:CAMPEP_0174920256 /NCGR_PEP_ID=MMETSP1355-20121228/4243_1 /TAXON_ID=464990 /ORGANISM="Hemiselmis tepida, Strain CCMP443" /LENGTH=318 /DNA_ID=CAMNT_0016165579 /DNA_START=332 /DNA_END=1288 /DNA_ORIENTATION=-
MIRTAAIAALAGAATVEAFAPGAALPGVRSARAVRPAMALKMQQQTKITYLTPELFKQLDKDGNGTIDLNELKDAVGYTADSDVKSLFARADLDGSGDIDYPEYQRLMNMERFGDAQGGSNDVRFALDSGLLKPDSILVDNIMVGNKGFDPAGFAKDTQTLNQYREAELKHGRLAMLAALGWPVAEYAQPLIAKSIGAPDLLAAGEKAPSLLNGGLDRINPLFFMVTLGFTAAVEVFGLKGGFADREPGDLGFDPLNLYYGSDEATKADYRLKELNNGRLAMIAITGYVIEDFFGATNVVTTTGKVAAPFVTGQPIEL